MPIQERIAKLSNKLTLKAMYFASNGYEYTSDDLYQIMIEAMINHAQRNPEFAEKPDAYLLQYASWRAQQACRASRTYTIYQEPEAYVISASGEVESAFLFIPDNSEPVEDQLIHREELDALYSLASAKNKTILSMLFLGYTESEIADKLHISRSALCQRKYTLKKSIEKA